MKRVIYFVSFFVFGLITSVFAAETEAAPLADGVKQFVALAAGFGIALSAAFGALGQGKAVAAALEGIARNPNAAPKMTTPLILGLAFIETLSIFTVLLGFMLFGKL
ncbi:MAG TPA: ATP synthase F0 subunit C [Bdellovibrionota bacterium]|nr:ATP synthase F0 subunit C [Bdellovibrionota bacterium]